MRPVVRYLHSPDAPELGRYQPKDPECWGLLIQAMIGPSDGPGEESFDFVYCSAKWIAAEGVGGGPRWLRHYLIDESYDLERLRDAVEQLCRDSEGSTWPEVAGLLGRYGKWEFEDYRQINS